MNITCVAVGSPMPYVKWMLNSEDLTPEDEMPVGRNVLELSSVRESANYTCVAMSSLGIIEAVAQITVKCKTLFKGVLGKIHLSRDEHSVHLQRFNCFLLIHSHSSPQAPRHTCGQ